MKVLVAGLGSIGQRHVRNLRAIFGDRVDILAYRVRQLPHVISGNMTIAEDSDIESAYGVRSFTSLDAALSVSPVATIVCNPTSLHLQTASAAIAVGSHVLVEKPLSDTSCGIDALVAAAEDRGLVAAVGFQMRFHPALLRLRELLSQGAIGAVSSVRAEWHEYLPDAHPYEDYRRSYAARADLGGGVILCYSHEIDYLQWLFGSARRVTTTGGYLSDLEIDVEDTAHTRMECCVGSGPLPIALDLNFASRQRRRTCTVEGEAGRIEVDLFAPSLTLHDRVGLEVSRESFDGFDRNQMFVDELRHFFLAIDGQPSSVATAREGALSLRTALAMKSSLATGRTIKLS